MVSTDTQFQDKKESTSVGTLGDYELLQTLGETHLYPVYLAQKEGSSKIVVIKTLETGDESFTNECRILNLPPHPHIVALEDTLKDVYIQFRSESLLNKFKSRNPKNAVVMELAENGDFFDYMLQGPLPDSITRYYFEQLLDAVEHLHKNNCCHLDLKLENILLDKDYNVKITDFGFSAQIEEGKPLYQKNGTPCCRPPEMWKMGSDFKGYDGVKADIFQLGLLFYIFVAGAPPFTEAQINDPWFKPILAGKWDVFWAFKEKAAKLRKEVPKVFDPDFKTLVSQLLNVDETFRPSTIEEIRESNWYKKTQPATEAEVMEEMKSRKKK